MNAKTVLLRTTGLLIATVMLAASGGLAWAAAGDYTSRDLVPAGVTVAGIELGGFSPAQVREAVERTVVEPLREPVSVRAGSAVFEIDPAEFLHADVEQAVSDAFEPNRTSTIAERIYRRLLEEPVRVEIAPEIAVDEEALSKRVAGMAVGVDVAPVDASVNIVDGALVLSPSSEGRSLGQTASVEIIAEALLSAETAVDLPVLPVEPEVAEADLGGWIVVRRASRTLELWEGDTLDRTYRVAVGAQGYATPRGEWEITLKRYLPTWGNPGSAWAADMPKTIPPGPNNPLGTRALNLNASGIRIHGTSNVDSIGTAASHGCVRMLRRDVEELYELVDVGTRVFVVER
ncbi:MAG: L,D-transpeptidase/peptidoglycan binding protein [Anaerosomatales bacterium]|nr:L,D-transpeptidase/peptidoglycan binding protein [Anaerosomatales bacterium]MDT8434084.1 L,D-transpeptidase/peptidoglycan binding protein [Anaerosomatales bacterium]